MYDEINNQVTKLPLEGLKKYPHNSAVTEDEVYYFPRIITPQKVGSDSSVAGTQPQPDLKPPNPIVMEVDNFCSPQSLTKMADMDVLMEDSMDGGPPSVGSGDVNTSIAATPSGPSTSTPASSRKKANKNKVVTGYILYSREYRKQIVQNNPDSNFGEISRIVGVEWRSLPANEKQIWEEKASKLNEETKAALMAEQELQQCSSPAPGASNNPDLVFECLWDNCDLQFEETQDLIEHCVKDSKDAQGHVQSYYSANPDQDVNCHWKNCARNNKKNCQPFPNVTRLLRHVREMHINKGNGRIIPPESRSKNFKPSSKPKPEPIVKPPPPVTPVPTPIIVQAPPPKQPDPIFISVPPRPQRVLHSEAYIKYIEGLQVDNKYISSWEKTLNATQETAPPPDPEKLQNVAAWLGVKAEQQDNVLAALWTLRNQLMKDTLGLHRAL